MRDDDLPIFCVSAAENEPRRVRMRRRMAELGLACRFLSAPLTAADVRGLVAATGRTEPPGFEHRTVAIMLGHLELIRRFVEETDASHVIVCEDDVYLRRTFRRDLPSIVSEFDTRSLDVLLLGYLWPWREVDEVGSPGYRFLEFNDEMWGTQMYLLSRRQAIHLVETYTLHWALDYWATRPFSSDWIITKVGRRARLSPMLAVEEGGVVTAHAGQVAFHRRCAEAQYDPGLYV
jgi:hypothetical protein